MSQSKSVEPMKHRRVKKDKEWGDVFDNKDGKRWKKR